MSDPLLNLAPQAEAFRGALSKGDMSSENQSFEAGGHPFARLLAGQSGTSGEAAAAAVDGRTAEQGGKLPSQSLPVDGKGLPVSLEEWLERTGLPLSGGEGTVTADPLAEGTLPATDPAAGDARIGVEADAAAGDAAAAVPAGEAATTVDGQAVAVPVAAQVATARNGNPHNTQDDADVLTGQGARREPLPQSVIPARAAAAQAGDSDVTQPPAATAADPARTLSTAIHQALQQARGDKERETSVGDLVRNITRANAPGSEASPRGEGANLSSVASTPSISSATQQSQALPTTSVQVPVRQQGWDQAVGEQVQWMVGQKLQSAEIKLNPAHLGPMEVRVQIHQDQATVHFTAQHGMVRDALEAAVPRLREMLAESGLNLNNVNVSDHSFAEQQRQQAQESSGLHFGYAGEEESPVEEMSTTLITTLRSGSGSIDYFA